MNKTLRTLEQPGWSTKPQEPLPENRLSAAEVDQNFLSLEQEIHNARFRSPDTLSSLTTNYVSEYYHTHQVVFPVTSVNGFTGEITITADDLGLGQFVGLTPGAIISSISNQHIFNSLGYVPENVSAKNQPNGYAGLDPNGKIPNSHIPALAITDTFPVPDETAMLNLDAQRGDVAVRTDLSKSFILRDNNPADLNSWQELLTPIDSVQSVNGFVGVVELEPITAGNYLIGSNYNGTHAVTWSVNGTELALPGTLVARDSSNNFSAGTITASLNGNATTASRLLANRVIQLDGDVTGSTMFDGSSNVVLNATMSNSGVSSGTYGNSGSALQITVDSKGRITSINAVGIRSGSTSQSGIVQLSDSTTSTSATLAATANSVRLANNNANTRVSKSGDSMTGFLNLHANPTANLHAATKQYVDAVAANASGAAVWGNIGGSITNQSDLFTELQQIPTKVSKSGDSMTGFLNLHANPTSNLHAATKQYVDAVASGASGAATWGNISGTLSNQSDLYAAIQNASLLTSGVVPNGRLNNSYTGLGSITPGSNNISNLGSPGLRWATVFATTFNGTSTAARYADLAERYQTDTSVTPGQVVVFGGKKEITLSTKANDSAVAGVISTNPAHLMNSALGDNDAAPAVALVGRVPCYVIGQISKGSLLVTSDIPGVAKAEVNPAPGTIIGKAMTAGDFKEPTLVEIFVGKA